MSIVENYNLFGEQGDLPDVVHCETIEARSLVHNWEFRPHRHARLHQVLLMDAGRGSVQIEDTAQALTGGDLVNLPPGVVQTSLRPRAV
ncbi:AraC family ligand binding domain-containing protein [Leisingera sp. F5]|uniref:AraC family ligand binding domain-containing protein n=1 Tax=Leisingera sp. F5 TaxID=1813816 RepID=UPI00345BC7D9